MAVKISVIIPCFNQVAFLEETLQSVLDQTYPHWECIIVNDGSPDNTEEIALEWCNKDERFVYLKKENGGLSSARNAGLNIAKGDFIQFLDSDDIILPYKLEESSVYFNDSIDLIVTDFQLLSGADFLPAFCKISEFEINLKNIVLHWDSGFNIPIHSPIFSKSSIGLLRFDTHLKSKEDWFFWIQYLFQPKVAVFLPVPAAIYRINPNSLGTNPELIHLANAHIYNEMNDEVKALIFAKLNQSYLTQQNRIKYLQQKLNAYQDSRLVLNCLRVHGLLRKIFKFS